MSDVATPIAACIATGLGATCAQAVANALVPELSAYGVTGPSLMWGLVGGYAGEMLRRWKAQEEGKPHPPRMAWPGLLLSGAIGALGGNWVAQRWFADSTAASLATATAGCSAFVGATWQWLVLALLPALIDAGKVVIARWAQK